MNQEEMKKRKALQDEHMKRILAQISEALNQALATYKDFPITPESIRNYKNLVMSQLLSINELSEVEKVSIDFEITQSKEDINSLLMSPKNLFTLLLMQGEYVPLMFLGNRNEYTTERGTWKLDDKGQCWFIPAVVANNITVDFTIKNDNSISYGPSDQENSGN